jgi:hypothetical protein
MLIVANGAFKSGSTWLFNILREMTGSPPVPDEYLNPDWVNPSIHPDKLEVLLEEVDHAERDSLVKNHFGEPNQKRVLLGNPNVYVFDIRRDLSDVVVSAYHHYQNKEDYEGTFQDFYWWRGRFIAMSVQEYHRLWDTSLPRTYVSSFEALKTNFEEEVRRIGNVLGYDLRTDEIERIHEETTLSSLREKYQDEEFFREGGTGYEEEYLNDRMRRDIAFIEENNINYSNTAVKVKEKVRGLFWGMVM